MRKIIVSFLLASTLFSVGCKKEKVFFEEELEGAQTGAGFGLPNQSPISLTLESSTTSYTEAINAFVSNGGSAELSLSVDESLVDAYNAANGTAFGIMPSDIYTLPNSISVSGGSGSSDATFDIQKLLTYGSSFAIGIKITGASGGTSYVLPGNSEKVIIVQVKNKYDGVYTWTITTTGWAAYGIADGVTRTYPGTYDMFTSGASSLDIFGNARGDNLLPAFTTDLQATAFGATSPRFTFDGTTDKITSVTNIIPDDGRGRALRINPDPSLANYWDAATGNIYTSFIMSATGRPDQYYTVVMTYVGSR